jgi:excisionase family DNA binding protein
MSYLHFDACDIFWCFGADTNNSGRYETNTHMMKQQAFPPLAYRIPDAVRVSGLGRTKIYELIKAGELKAVLVGGRRLIPADALKALLDV